MAVGSQLLQHRLARLNPLPRPRLAIAEQELHPRARSQTKGGEGGVRVWGGAAAEEELSVLWVEVGVGAEEVKQAFRSDQRRPGQLELHPAVQPVAVGDGVEAGEGGQRQHGVVVVQAAAGPVRRLEPGRQRVQR